MIIIFMYKDRGNLKKQMKSLMLWTSIYALVSFIFVNKNYGIIQLFVFLVYPLLKMYNGERENIKWMKWFFYLYYPLHLIIIGIVRVMMYGNVALLFN